jgi:small subunit ribosomal protein S16
MSQNLDKNGGLQTPQPGIILCTLLAKSLVPVEFWFRRFSALIDQIFFMPGRIRMKRVGAKNAPVFRIVVADGRSPRDGKFIEQIGTYQPRKKSDNVKIDLDRAKYWISKGAQPSDTVASFIKKANKAATTAVAA